MRFLGNSFASMTGKRRLWLRAIGFFVLFTSAVQLHYLGVDAKHRLGAVEVFVQSPALAVAHERLSVARTLAPAPRGAYFDALSGQTRPGSSGMTTMDSLSEDVRKADGAFNAAKASLNATSPIGLTVVLWLSVALGFLGLALVLLTGRGRDNGCEHNAFQVADFGSEHVSSSGPSGAHADGSPLNRGFSLAQRVREDLFAQFWAYRLSAVEAFARSCGFVFRQRGSSATVQLDRHFVASLGDVAYAAGCLRTHDAHVSDVYEAGGNTTMDDRIKWARQDGYSMSIIRDMLAALEREGITVTRAEAPDWTSPPYFPDGPGALDDIRDRAPRLHEELKAFQTSAHGSTHGSEHQTECDQQGGHPDEFPGFHSFGSASEAEAVLATCRGSDVVLSLATIFVNFYLTVRPNGSIAETSDHQAVWSRDGSLALSPVAAHVGEGPFFGYVYVVGPTP